MTCCRAYAANGDTLRAAADPAADGGLWVRLRLLTLLLDCRPTGGDKPGAYRPLPMPTLLLSLSDDGDGDVPPLLLAGLVAADDGGGLLATAGLPQLLSVTTVAVAVSMLVVALQL